MRRRPRSPSKGRKTDQPREDGESLSTISASNGNGHTTSSSNRFRLQTARVAGFRSFKHEETITFGHAGLTCITGPNGAGKSTLLNAILYGLGENATQLGARQNAELASAPYAEVELVFRSVSRAVSDIKVSSVVSKANGQRTYIFNGQKLPKHRFDHLLRVRLRIATGNPFWRLNASPHALHDALCEVSGTKAINTHWSNALKQLVRWKRSLAEIQSNIAMLEEAVGKEGAYLQAMDRVREITAELNAIPVEMKNVDREIARAELRATARLVEKLTSELKTLEIDKVERQARIQALEAEIGELRKEGDETGDKGGSETLQEDLLKVLTDLARASTEAQLETAALDENTQLNNQWDRILREAQKERLGIEAKTDILRDTCAGLREKKRKLEEEVDRSRTQLLTTERSFEDPEGTLKAARQTLEEHKSSADRAEARRALASSAVSRAEEDVSKRRAEATAAAAVVDEAWESMKRLGSPLLSTEDVEKYLKGVEDQRHIQRSRQLDLSRDLEKAKQACSACRRRLGAPEWCTSLKRSDAPEQGAYTAADATERDRMRQRAKIPGHRGFLFELFQLQQDTDEKHFEGLASLLSGSLTVWVCTSSQEADEALDLAKASSAGLRVWPTERLRSADTSDSAGGPHSWQQRCFRIARVLQWAENKWPGQVKVIDPASLLVWDETDLGLTVAMEKALGGWVITEDDDVSTSLLEFGQSSITAMGVRHAPAVVIGGEAQGEGARLRAKTEWDRASRKHGQIAEKLESCAEGCKDLTRRLGSGREFALLQTRRTRLKKEAEECEMRLHESERNATAARDKLEWASAERDRLDREAAILKGSCARLDTASTPADKRNAEEILETLRTGWQAREQELAEATAVCTDIETEIGSLAEASMEALEREYNAKEALGIATDGTADSTDSHSDLDYGRRQDTSGGMNGTGIAPVAPPVVGSGAGDAEGCVLPRAVDRLAALTKSVQTKVARLAELERARDDLTARVEEATARELGAGDRLLALEVEVAEAKGALREVDTRAKSARKSLSEAECRLHEASMPHDASIEEDARASDAGVAEKHHGPAMPNVRQQDTEAQMDMDDSMDIDVPPKSPSVSTVRATTGSMLDKENFPSGLPEEELTSMKYELEAKEKFLSSELRGLRQRRSGGKGQGIAAGSVDEVTVRQRQAKVGVLKRQLESVVEATRQLEAGAVACEGRMREANEACYSAVRRELQTLFGALCTNKSADLVFAGRKLEDGLRLVVSNESATAVRDSSTPSSDGESTRAAGERSPRELSGGQQALLGLALVLALSSYQAPPLCLLDEVDAALDETNQAAAARLVAMAFEDGQALCVSHHSGFHRQSGHCIAVEMRDGVTKVQQNG